MKPALLLAFVIAGCPSDPIPEATRSTEYGVLTSEREVVHASRPTLGTSRLVLRTWESGRILLERGDVRGPAGSDRDRVEHDARAVPTERALGSRVLVAIDDPTSIPSLAIAWEHAIDVDVDGHVVGYTHDAGSVCLGLGTADPTCLDDAHAHAIAVADGTRGPVAVYERRGGMSPALLVFTRIDASGAMYRAPTGAPTMLAVGEAVASPSVVETDAGYVVTYGRFVPQTAAHGPVESLVLDDEGHVLRTIRLADTGASPSCARWGNDAFSVR